ncbi:sensor histidine kinase [Mangrovibacterium lignilyticum]|uniref:sensor histidine kinase n=1 Tax=Mangrovibacterium lignilyticum TaxID=2668052 RepID=UPI0013CF4C06|nr:HAMP domain-containing sensor histidine kinase [Mangrovibacterium lignilyticum]
MSNNFLRFRDLAGKVVLGKYKEGTFEQRLTIVGCLTVVFVSVIATVSNFVLGLYNIGLITLALLIVSTFCFSTARFGIFPKWLIHVIFLIAIIFYNLSWLFNFGSQGPTLNLIIGIYVFFILIWKRKNYFVLVSLCLVNVCVLFLIEYNFPGIVGNYSDEKTRILDVYSGVCFAIILTFFMAVSVKRNYIVQYERAKKSDQLKTSFLANLSHEVRTPLNVIAGFTSMIPEMNYSDEDLKKIHKVIDLNGKQLLFLIEDIIDLSKLEVNQLELHATFFDLKSVFSDFKSGFEAYSSVDREHKVKLDYKIDLENSQIYADELRVSQVLRCLITNSYRFSDHGVILFGCYQEGSELIFYVKDTGRGIKPEFEEQIFDLFVKFQNRDHTIESGVGIGLHLSKKLVELMGGTIWYKTKYLEGSEFYFSIPYKRG